MKLIKGASFRNYTFIYLKKIHTLHDAFFKEQIKKKHASDNYEILFIYLS